MLRFEMATEDIIDSLNGNDRRFDLGTTSVFYSNDKVIGHADYFIIENILFLKNIETITLRKGFGKSIIKYLFDSLKIEKIHGYFINETSEYFWKSLNATFEQSEIKGKFILERENFNK